MTQKNHIRCLRSKFDGDFYLGNKIKLYGRLNSLFYRPETYIIDVCINKMTSDEEKVPITERSIMLYIPRFREIPYERYNKEGKGIRVVITVQAVLEAGKHIATEYTFRIPSLDDVFRWRVYGN